MITARKLWYLLSQVQRRHAFMLLTLMLVGMVLETLGIGLVIPAMGLMTQGDLVAKYPDAVPLLDWLGNPTQGNLLLVGMSILVAVYLVKTMFLGFLAWHQSRFTYNLQSDLSYRLFAGYLRQPYSFHLQRN
ncbi:MAG: ABC transporter ATP-binding protein, partial [Betaproteobacteria bacterium]|nr:ABC transporter ATP-binding protein [Betaproteobacteria bacterium]